MEVAYVHLLYYSGYGILFPGSDNRQTLFKTGIERATAGKSGLVLGSLAHGSELLEP